MELGGTSLYYGVGPFPAESACILDWNLRMKNCDVIVAGSGAGITIFQQALWAGLSVALIDKASLLGGTCLNPGCIPSKTLICHADRIVEIQEAAKVGIIAEVREIDFPGIM